MGDVITRFKLETTQFDSKLRDEAKRLSDLTNQLSLAGKDFNKFAQQHVETARSFGQVASGATNLKDKLRDLVGAYNQVAKAYNAMSKEQQQTDYGKAMAESLQKLQGDIRQTKEEMNAMPGVLDKLTDRFTVNIDAIKLFNVGLQAAEGALKVAKDAFFASEANVDEWGRIVQSSKSVYEGFLTALNTGDISGYLSRIDEIVSAARTAYNELDRLGTMKTIQAPAMSAQQTENERMRMMIQTGRYIAPMDGRKATMQNGQLLTPDQIRRIEQMLQGGMQKMVTLVGNEVNQTGKAIDALYTSQAKDLGLSLKEFRKGTSSMAEFDKRMAGYDQYQQWRAAHTTIDQQSGREIVARGNPFAQYAKWGAFRVDGDRYNQLVQLIQQRNQQQSSAYGMQSQAYRAINRAEGITLKGIMGGGGSGGGGSIKTEQTEMQKNQQTINTLTQEYVRISDNANEETRQRQEEIRKEIHLLEQRNNLIKLYQEQAQGKLQGGDIQTTGLGSGSFAGSFKDMKIEGLDEETMEKVRKGMANMNQTANESKTSFQGAAAAVSAMGNALGSIKDPGVQIMGMIGQAIASIALGFAQASAKEGKGGIWYWIAATAAGLATMIATISSIHSATGYAQGGIVKGNSYSGDNIYGGPDAMVNAGELVLTRAQQSTLASALQGNGLQNMNIAGRIKGTDIILSIDRSLKLEGKQLLTWGR